MDDRRTPLRRDRNFVLFWGVQTLSVAGDSFSYVAIPLLVLHATGSVAQMGLLTGAAGIASICTGVFAGIVADRVNRRFLLIACDTARAVLFALVPLAWWFSAQVWLLYAVMPLAAAAGMLFQVGYVTVVPRLVDPDRITEANGRLYATYAAAGIGGPMCAGVVSGLFGPTAAIGIDAASFLLAALGLCLVRLRAPARAPAVPHSQTQPQPQDRPAQAQGTPAEPPGQPAEPQRTPATPDRAGWRDLLVGAAFLLRHPVLRTLTVLLSFVTFLTLGLTDVFIYHVKHDLAGSDRTVGYVLATAASGTIVAALLVAPARRRLGFGFCWIAAVGLCGFAVAGVGLSGTVLAVAALAAIVTFGLSLGGICSMSLRQEVTPDHLLGRVTSAFWTLHSVLGPLGAAVLTVAAGRYGVAAVCLSAGVAYLAIAVVAAFTPIRQPRPEQLAFDTA